MGTTRALITGGSVGIGAALALGRRAGVDPQLLFDALAKGSADSFALRNHGMKAMLQGEYPERAFSVAYAAKDNAYALELGRETGVRLRGAQLLAEVLGEADAAGWRDAATDGVEMVAVSLLFFFCSEALIGIFTSDPGVIAVGAVDMNDKLAEFSTYGVHVSFVAPGAGIISSYPGDKYSMSSGTSQASPYVAGAIALLKSVALKAGRKLKDNPVKYILKHTSDRLGGQFKDMKSGYGRINLLDAIKLLKYKLSI